MSVTTEPTMTEPPDELPTYVEDTISTHADEPDVLAAIRDYAAELYAVADEESPSPDEIAASRNDGTIERFQPGTDGWTYVNRKVTCGDETCKCADGELHGPYWYKVRRDGDGLTWEYVGKEIEGDVDADGPAAGD